MVSHVFIPTSGPLQVIFSQEDASAAIQGAAYAISLANGISLTCSGSNTFSEVNERATKLAGFTIQGDAALKMTAEEDVAVVDYLQSRKLSLLENDIPELPRPSRRHSTESTHTPQQLPESSDVFHMSLWSEIPPEIFMQVMEASLVDASLQYPDHGGALDRGNCAVVLAAASVCRSWRSLILNAEPLLKDVRFHINPAKPFAGPAIPVHTLRRIECPPIPYIVYAALRLGNETAAYSIAAILDLQGKRNEAIKLWRKAAKAGIRKAQLQMGEAFYKGSCNLPQDPEEAMLWLNRTVRGLEEVPAAPCQVAAQAFLLLGFMYFDGEGVPRSEEGAVRNFRRAASFGSREAEQTLGSIYNTGQYGSLNRWR
eukprot:CAMPEP_0117664040 /NCGR_PEP_ID=MMETSP0804-20121206/8975_1 /TAXON_ID=1074897 /ORGANISM="Tetraselmis astigmatica, Strain CCMP880" /LENGTH=369 /DNA_ID=CAMNT_0005471181 /DNA_START=181 /DNA_END=1290 /DNA_ORIENTATION=-